MNARRRGGAWGLLGFFLIAALAGAADVQAGPRFVVQARLPEPEQPPGARTDLEVTFECAPDYYVWHDTIKVELTGAGSAGAGGAAVSVGPLSLPEPKEKDDPLAGGRLKYLDGTFTATLGLAIGAEVKPGDYGLTFHVSYTGCGPDICELGSEDVAARLTVSGGPAVPSAGPVAPPPMPAGGEAAQVELEVSPELAGQSPIVVILLAFLAGLGLTFTPCIYPLIPVTVALVGATAGRGRLDGLVRSLVYVLGISVTYSVVGVAAAATGGMFGAWLQRPAVYVALAAVFVLLAGGMFDVYSIDISSQRLQRMQAALRGRWGLVGIWLIGVLSGAAATACIAPVILGMLGYVAQRGSMLLGFLIFFAMAWGMGASLVALGTFTGLLKALPKSGQWMVTIKYLFGLALVAVAVYFVGRSRLLSEAWFRGLIGAALVAAAVYAGAFDVLTRGSGWYARLRKTFGLLLLVAAGAAFLFAGEAVLGEAAWPTRPIGAQVPSAIWWGTLETDALARAKAEGKPVLLDFWAEWCNPCLKMLKTTFVDPRVVAESQRFVCAKIDVGSLGEAQMEGLRERYALRGVPTVVLISTTGKRTVLAGYHDADALIQVMQTIR